jgi:hypothetical protein
MSVQNLKLRVLTKFPASVTAGTGLLLTNTGGVYSITLSPDIATFAASVSTLTAHGVMLGTGTSAPATTAALTNGQLLVGQTGGDPLPKTISGDITVAASGAVALTNIPNGATMAGAVVATNIAAPSTPSAGAVKVYTDSTSKTLSAKNDAGTVTMTVAALSAGATNVVVNSMANGVLGTTTVSTPSILGFTTASNSLTVGATSYVGDGLFGTTSNQDGVVRRLPFACTISNLFVSCTVAPGAAKNFAYTIQKNGVDTTITATISGAATTSASDTTHSVSFAQGDTIALKAVVDAAAASASHSAVVKLAFS